MEGSATKTRKHMEILAWHAANIMNTQLKNKVRPSALLGKQRDLTAVGSAEDIREHMKDRHG